MVAKYIREVRKFINFQEINSRPLLFPANATHLALYLSTLLRKDSKTTVLSAYSALKWIYGCIPVQFNHEELKLTQEFSAGRLMTSDDN